MRNLITILAVAMLATAGISQSTGWTSDTFDESVEPYREFYVDPVNGTDSPNTSGNPFTPFKTIQWAVNKANDVGDKYVVINLQPDATYTESVNLAGLNGESVTRPMVIRANPEEDGERPIVATPSSSLHSFHVANGSVREVAIVGLHFKHSSYTGDDITNSEIPRLIELLSDGLTAGGERVDNILIEDCYFENAGAAIVISHNRSDDDPTYYNSGITIRRNVFTNIYTNNDVHPNPPISQGIFLDEVKDILIEENFFYRVSSDPDERINDDDSDIVYNGTEGDRGYDTILNHAIYLQNTTIDATIQGNIIFTTGSHGIQARGHNMAIRENYITDVSVAINLGLGSEQENVPNGGGSGVIENNVIHDLKDIVLSYKDSTSEFNYAPRGWAILAGNLADNSSYTTRIYNNIIANTHKDQASGPEGPANPGSLLGNNDEGRPFILDPVSGFSDNDPDPDTQSNSGVQRLTIQDNVVYDFAGRIEFIDNKPTGSSVFYYSKSVSFIDNEIQNPDSRNKINQPWIMTAGHEDEWKSAAGGEVKDNTFYDAKSTTQLFTYDRDDASPGQYTLSQWQTGVSDKWFGFGFQRIARPERDCLRGVCPHAAGRRPRDRRIPGADESP